MKRYKILIFNLILGLTLFFGCNKNIKYDYWDNGRKKSSINYKENKKHGKALYWTKEGVKEKEELYKNDELVEYKEYYDNKKLKGYFFNVAYDTIEVEDIPTGDIMIQELRTRKGFEYHINGEKKKAINVVKGKKEGKWTYWNEQGKLLREEIYHLDSLISVREY